MSRPYEKDSSPPVSRLQLVREGRADTAVPAIPRRGRLVVDIESIVPDMENERKVFREIEDLAKSIQVVGIVEPPTVVPTDEPGLYKLTTGERRWRAARLAGLKRIPVIVGEAEEEPTRRLKSLISNIQRADLSVVELAQALQAMKDDRPDVNTNRDLVPLTGKSEQWIGAILRILSLPTAMQQQLNESEKPIAYEVAIEVARMPDGGKRQLLFNEALQGATVRQIKHRAKELRGKSSQTGRIKPTRDFSYSVKNEHVTVRIQFRDQHIRQEARLAALKMAFEEALEIEEAKRF